MTHHIDTPTLRRAAEQLLTIDDAGYGPQLDRELFELTDGDECFRGRQNQRRWQERLATSAVELFAQRLAQIADCPIDQARGVAIDLLGYGERRAVAIDLLARMSGEVRRVQTQSHRQTRMGRRSA